MTNDLPRGEPLAFSPPPEPARATLEGYGLRLEPLEADRDAEDLYAISHGDARREALWTYMGGGPFADVDALRTSLHAAERSTDPLFFTVRDAASGRALGQNAYLSIAAEHGRIEIGHIWYAPEAQRGSVNTAAATLLIGNAFALGYRRVEWKCDALNARSRAAAERLGFRFEGVFRQHLVVKGRNRDTAWFSLLDREWPVAGAALEEWLEADPAARAPLAELRAAREAGHRAD